MMCDGSKVMCECNALRREFINICAFTAMIPATYIIYINFQSPVKDPGYVGLMLLALAVFTAVLMIVVWMILGKETFHFKEEVENKPQKPKVKEPCKDICSDPSCHDCRWRDVVYKSKVVA